jgi:alpha-tubulin suppressor-like RCC1 family protein
MTGISAARELVILALLAPVASCGTDGGVRGWDRGGGASGDDASAGDDSGFADGSLDCSNDNAVRGCACPSVGATAACWTGPASQRGAPGCHDGVAQCTQQGEFTAWGPCQGEKLDCPNEPPAPNPNGCPPLSAGALHVCAVTPAHGVKCWGYNEEGQLGDGTTTSTTAPVDVVGLTSGVACVAAGEVHTCALMTSGAVKCWGDAISNGSGSQSSVPLDVPGLGSGVVALTTGESDTCAVLGSGAIKCWGHGGEDEKDPTTNYGATPVAIAGVPPQVKAVFASDGFNCLLTTAGGVQCWGGNSFGELGNGTTTPSATPVQVTGLASGVSWLSANGGTAGCVVVSGGVQCWGKMGSHQSSTPAAMQGLTSGVSQVYATGEQTGCALMQNGTVQCWGGGQAPTTIGVSNVTYISANEGCSCGLTSNHKIYCWGLTLPAITNCGSCLGDGKTPTGGNTTQAVEVQGF